MANTSIEFIQRLSAFFNKLKINIRNFVTTIFSGIKAIIKNNTNFIFWFLFFFIALSVLGIALNICWLICLMGLLWVFLLFSIFSLAINIKINIDSYLKGIDDFKEALEKNSLGVLYTFSIWFIKVTNKITYSIGGLSIALTHIFAKIHIYSANGKFSSLFDIQNISIFDILITIGTLAYGIISDLSNLWGSEKKSGRNIVAIAYVQLYFILLILFTGFWGGETAIKGIALIFDLKKIFPLIQTGEIFQYFSIALYVIYIGMGKLSFIFFYFLIPFYIILNAKVDLKRIAQGQSTKLPIFALKSLILSSCFFLSIFIYISWSEGWISLIMNYIIWIIYTIVKLIKSFFS